MASNVFNPHIMEIAQAAAKEATPFDQVGACIAEGNNIIGIGRSKFPDWFDPFDADRKYSIDNPELFMTTATFDAYISTRRRRLDGCTLYVTQFPTNLCVKIILQVGIREIFFVKHDDDNKTDIDAAMKMFNAAQYIITNNYIYKP